MDPDPYPWIRILFPSWIQIRIQYTDPEPGGKIFKIKTEKMQGNWEFIQFFKVKFAQAPLFLTFEQSFMFFLQL